MDDEVVGVQGTEPLLEVTEKEEGSSLAERGTKRKTLADPPFKQEFEGHVKQ